MALAGTACALLSVQTARAQLNLLPELAAKSKAVPVKPKATLIAKKTATKKNPAIKPKALAAAKVTKKPAGKIVAKTVAKIVAKTAAKTAPKTASKTEPKPKIEAKIEAKIVAQPVPLPRQRPSVAALKVVPPPIQANLGLPSALFAPVRPPPARPPAGPFAVAPTNVTPPADVAALKRVLEAAHKGKDEDADAAEKTITDPVARKLAEWAILRSDNSNPGFRRYADFAAANPSWPHATLFRKRAEAALWNDHADAASVLAYFGNAQPLTAKGRYALAQALLAKGDRARAAELVREAWRNHDCSDETEARVIAMFGDMLSAADHKARMDRRFYEEDVAAGLRAAKRIGGGEVALAQAWTAVIKRAHNAKALLDAVPAETRNDAGYIFARAHWLRKEQKLDEAARLILAAPRDAQAFGPDAWWQERRVLVRALLDQGDAKTAYRIAAEAVTPEKPVFRGDKFFTAGWIALRYLNDAKSAAAQFAHVAPLNGSPHGLSRGGYWQGRAAEAMGEHAKAKRFYEMAAAYTATYYGQLARAKLGLSDLGLRGPPHVSPQERAAMGHIEVVRAAELLYALNERDLLASIFAEIGANGTDIAGMTMLAEVAAKHDDGRSIVLLGEEAYGRGLPFEYFAYPTFGLPNYQPIAPPIDAAVAYSIARQESRFNQKVVSPAHAMGLMQVTPAAGIDTAKRFKAVYNRARLLSDPVYNMQMGAAELSNLFMGYNGSYILTFAGYNAGRGRVKQWIAAYGDPREAGVDPVDWVERIPLSETRNYVMRIMENLQVYRARFGGSNKLLIEADLRRGAAN